MELSKKRVLTGVKPTGKMHLGNLIGAVRPVIEMSEKAEETIVFIADLHALNSIHDPKLIREYTYEIAATFLALGLNTDKVTFFRQSDIPELYAFYTLLSNVTPKGLMNRAHAYKDKVQVNEEEGRDPDAGVNMGLFTYPLLMAADILLYDADLVPVGKDQKQHIEIARDIAGAFNHLYGQGEELLRVPDAVIPETANAIVGLDGRKMSKSYDNTIALFDSAKQLRKQVMRIVTDSREPEEPKDPEEVVIYQLYNVFASEEQRQEMYDGFAKGGLRYGDAKKMLADVLETILSDPRERYEALMNDTHRIEEALNKGAHKAQKYASKVLKRISNSMLGRTVLSQ